MTVSYVILEFSSTLLH